MTAAAVTRSCRLRGRNDRVTAAGTRPDRRHESQRRFAFKEQRRRLNLRGRCICRRRVVSGSQIFLLVQLARSRLTIGCSPAWVAELVVRGLDVPPRGQRRKVRARPSPSACSYTTALSSNVATASASSSKALDGVQADLLVSAGGQNAEVRRNGAAATLHDERRREGQCSAVANDDRPCRKLPVVPVASRCLATRSPVAVSQASTKVSQGKGSDSGTSASGSVEKMTSGPTVCFNGMARAARPQRYCCPAMSLCGLLGNTAVMRRDRAAPLCSRSRERAICRTCIAVRPTKLPHSAPSCEFS